MRKVEWTQSAQSDLFAILDYISDDNLPAALALQEEIDLKTNQLPLTSKHYRQGRVSGTREMVVRPNYIVVYAEQERRITILRILHAAQRWP